jgi:hypothetical protein
VPVPVEDELAAVQTSDMEEEPTLSHESILSDGRPGGNVPCVI